MEMMVNKEISFNQTRSLSAWDNAAPSNQLGNRIFCCEKEDRD